jgi:hypothetical protein
MDFHCTDSKWDGKMTEVKQLARPENKGVVDRKGGPVEPWQLDPELAQLKLAELMIEKLGTPSIINKKFIVRYGIWTALNHRDPVYDNNTGILLDPGNPTGIDCTLRLKVYEKVAAQSINENGEYFRSYWAFMMKPKYIIQGNVGQPIEQEEKQSLIGRAIGWFTGGNKKNAQQQQGQG